ncbi:MAG: LysM peptidoglycan-binding domain-containing protein [Kiritimatiellae bacterium]|nr:LysM peptidoglycan-binding domain-containing protein [Kiritimatiellia bacterium]
MKNRVVVVVAVVAAAHCAAVGVLLSFSGCGRTGGLAGPVRLPEGRPPQPVMPPTSAPDAPVVPPPSQTPVSAEPAPLITEPEQATAYVVRNGDSLSRIAKRHGVHMTDIMQMNGLRNPNKLLVGQKLLLPSYATAWTPPAEKETAEPAAPAGGEVGVYVVRKNDCLSRIAARHGIALAALREANGLKGDRILVGQELKIPGSASAARAVPAPETALPTGVSEPEPTPVADEPPEESMPDAEAPAPAVEEEALAPADSPAPPIVAAPAAASLLEGGEQKMHFVEPNEDLEAIAAMYPGVRVEDIMRANALTVKKVEPGQRLQIPPAPKP